MNGPILVDCECRGIERIDARVNARPRATVDVDGDAATIELPPAAGVLELYGFHDEERVVARREMV